jgi:hypothetical protein
MLRGLDGGLAESETLGVRVGCRKANRSRRSPRSCPGFLHPLLNRIGRNRES